MSKQPLDEQKPPSYGYDNNILCGGLASGVKFWLLWRQLRQLLTGNKSIGTNMFSKSKKPDNKDMVVAPVPMPPKDTGSDKSEKENSSLVYKFHLIIHILKLCNNRIHIRIALK